MLLSAYLAVAFLAVVLAAGRATRSWTWNPAGLAVLLQSPWAPIALGLLTAVIVRFVWGSFGEPGVIHDERAYLLQAQIFSHGRWTAASPPIAEFFEQMHVFVEPAVFAKYPPVHAMLLVPGIWLGLPGLMPVVMAGTAGALTFWLARRLSNVWTALLTWMLWTTAPITLIWATSYMSESTTIVMWLAAASATVLWLDSGKQVHLLGAAVALALGFEARPLTMAALALPLGFVIVRRIIERGKWRALAVPVLAGCVLLGLGPLWNQRTLGDWRSDPYPLYSRTYFPFDKPGFGVDPAPSVRPLPTELRPMDTWSRALHASYVPSAMPLAFAQRVLGVLSLYAVGWRLALAALLIGGLARARGAAGFAAVSSLGLFVAYLAFAHPPSWVVYYVELLPGLHFLAAGNLVRLLGQSRERLPRADAQLPAVVARACAVAAVPVALFCVSDLPRVRAAIDVRNGFHRRAAQVIRAAPPNSILFVRYPTNHDPHLAITRNEADLSTAASWIVYDRGADNARLLAVAPNRQPYVLDVATFGLEPLVTSPDELSQLRIQSR